MDVFIKQKVDLIAESVFSKIEKNDEDESYGLYSGKFGILLFLFYYSRYSMCKNHRIITENYAEKLFNQFLVKVRSHSFCDGFSGILYLFEVLRENHFIDMDISHYQAPLDDFLITQMKYDIQHCDYDFMHASLGVGLYFMKKRTNLKYIDLLIDFLYQSSEKDIEEQIFKWKTIIDYDRNLVGYNLSLSHGISSIIIFLSRAICLGRQNEKIMKMLSGAVSYLLSHQKNFSQFGSFFPNYLIINSKKNVSKSRLAWCYGDLGIGISLWKAGETVNNKEWKNEGLKILLQSTIRQNYNETFVNDAGICHGSAGNILIYRRMFLETNLNEFKNAADFWTTKTLDFLNFENELIEYKTYEKNGWINNYSLLTGISGIGLVLLMCLGDDKQIWDEIFLLSP